MAETRHTPGPWGLRGGTGMDLIAGPDGKALMSNERPSVELIANALLIAAAPALLQALREAHWLATRQLRTEPFEDQELDRAARALELSKAAIEKAEGRADG